jgi:iron complex transport system substrate-binding protein
MKKRTLKTLVALMLLTTSLFASGTKEIIQLSVNENILTTSTTFVDSFDREVTIPKEVKKVVSLGPNITEIIAELDPKALVGITDYCDYPLWVKDLPSIGKLSSPNIEKIIEMNPDLVLGSTHVKREVVETLEKAGITTAIVYNSDSLDGSYKVVLDVGILLNKSSQAQAIVEKMKKDVETVKKTIKDLPKPTVYYVVSFGQWGEYTAGGNTFIGKMIEEAGGINIAQDIQGWTYSLESLIDADPDIIIISKYFDSFENFATTEPYSELRAVKENHLYEIDNNKLDRQGIRNAEGMVDLAHIIHPEVF